MQVLEYMEKHNRSPLICVSVGLLWLHGQVTGTPFLKKIFFNTSVVDVNVYFPQIFY